MIIKSEMVQSKRTFRLLEEHLLGGGENEEVHLLRGSVDEVNAAFNDARIFGRKNALVHYILSPSEPIERMEAFDVFRRTGLEFGFSIENVFIVEHLKRRAVEGVFDRHWHMLVPNVDPTNGKCLDLKHNFLRHDVLASIARFELGHAQIAGAHQRSVLSKLEKIGRHDVAAALMKAGINGEGPRPRAGFSFGSHQRGKRQGIDVPKIRAVVREAWANARGSADFERALTAHGLTIAPGDKSGVWAVSHGGAFVGAGHRLVGVRNAEFCQRMGVPSDRDHAAERTGLFPASGIEDGPPARTSIADSGQRNASTGGFSRTDRPSAGDASKSDRSNEPVSTGIACSVLSAASSGSGSWRKLNAGFLLRLPRIAVAQTQADNLAANDPRHFLGALQAERQNLEKKLKDLSQSTLDRSSLIAAEANVRKLVDVRAGLRERIAAGNARLTEISEEKTPNILGILSTRVRVGKAERASIEAVLFTCNEQLMAADEKVRRARDWADLVREGLAKRQAQVIEATIARLHAVSCCNELQHALIFYNELQPDVGCSMQHARASSARRHMPCSVSYEDGNAPERLIKAGD